MAESIYVALLNQTRHHERMLRDPFGLRSIPSTTPVKWAVMSVLSTQCGLTVSKIQKTLAELSYRRGMSAIRRGLKRCRKFGLVISEKLSFDIEDNSIVTTKPKRWYLTDRGKQLINSPRKPMRQTVYDKVVDALASTSAWLSVSELHNITKASPSRIRRVLASDVQSIGIGYSGKFKSEKIPGDKNGRYQWALSSSDTTGWANAVPVVVPKQPSTGRVRVVKSSSQPTQQVHVGVDLASGPSQTVHQVVVTYGGKILMCAPTNKPSLIKAIGDLLVNEFITSGKKFTAHDVTQRMRHLVLQRAKNNTLLRAPLQTPPYAVIDITEVGEVHVSGYKIPRIDHEDVKSIVHELFKMGGLIDIDRMMDGDRWVYDTKENIAAELSKSQPAPIPAPVVKADPLSPPPPILKPLTIPTVPDPVAIASGSSYDGRPLI
jgi:hypothetical protein